MQLGIPTTGTFNWRPHICRCRFGWIPSDGLAIGPLNEVEPDFYEPCGEHEALDGSVAHRQAQERQLLWNMALSHATTNTPDAVSSMDVSFDTGGVMIVDAPSLDLEQKAALASACNDLVNADAVRVR